jgi:S-DNA-T family DNA segregation ATPase FtsK/SpoIIIE
VGRRPAVLGALAGLAGLVWLAQHLGWHWALAVGHAAAAVASAVVERVRPGQLRRSALGGWRRVTLYRRLWDPAMRAAGLHLDPGGHLPRLGRVTVADGVDRVAVRMLPGQTVTDWAQRGEELAQTFGALDCRAVSRPGRPRHLELRLLRADPLTAPVPPPQPIDGPRGLAAVPVGVREDGQPLTLPVFTPGRGATHLLIAGETGAGKGSVLGSLLAGLAPGIGAGLVEVWGIDPKGGMELAPWAPLLRRFVWGEPLDGRAWQEPIAELLEDAVAVMQARASAIRGVARAHTPSPSEPLLVVLVDELASLTAYVDDPALRRRIANALSLLLSQGRAPAVAVIAATQDVRKEVVGMRDLFPRRVVLRVAEPGQVDLALGAGARARGARADRIDPRLPGVGYVAADGEPEPVRGRFAYLDDDAVAGIVEAHRPRPVLAS